MIKAGTRTMAITGITTIGMTTTGGTRITCMTTMTGTTTTTTTGGKADGRTTVIDTDKIMLVRNGLQKQLRPLMSKFETIQHTTPAYTETENQYTAITENFCQNSN